MTKKRGRPRKHPDRKKYLADYMQKYRQQQKEQMNILKNELQKSNPNIERMRQIISGSSTRKQKKKTRKAKK